jgi:SAM-dependent methyltransferase
VAGGDEGAIDVQPKSFTLMPRLDEGSRVAKVASKARLARQAIDRFLVDVAAQLAPNTLVVDGGAGNCKHKNFFPHLRYIAFDFKPRRRRVYGEIDLSADLYQMPFRKDTFEAAINVDVLEHLKKPREVLKELCRVLRPGGNLFLIAPQGWQEHGMPNDYFRFTSSGLGYLLEQAGFEIVSIRPLGGFFWYLGHRISLSYRYLFPTKRRMIWKILDAPVRHPARLLLRFIIPYLCFHLDALGKEKSFTLNYGCVCRKPV